MSEKQKKEFEETIEILKELDPQKLALVNAGAKVLHASQMMSASEKSK